jgi:hypothetical protein
MAAFVIRALLGEIPEPDPKDPPFFGDVPRGHPFFKYIQKVKELRIDDGCSQKPDLFCPGSDVTRGETAGFIIRGKILTLDTFMFSPNPFFTDVGDADVFFGPVQKVKELGIVDGCSPAEYCPANPVSRGEAASFITRGFLINQGSFWSWSSPP